MKKFLIVVNCLLCGTMLRAQTAGVSRPVSLNIVKEVIPAILDIVPNSIEFVDKSGNNAIDANETCYLRFTVRNTGKGEGIGCKAKISATGTIAGISYQSKDLPTIAPNSTQVVEIPLAANMQTQDGSITIRFEVTEPQGFGTDPNELTVATKAFVSPMLKIVDYSVSSATGGGQIQKKSPFELQLLLQNTQHGKAENVEVQVSWPEGVYMTDGQEVRKFATLEAGDAKTLVYQLIVTNNYAATTIPIKVSVKEKYGKYAESKTIDLPIISVDADNSVTISGTSTDAPKTDITIGTLRRDNSTTMGSATYVRSVTIITSFDVILTSSVLASYNNEFKSFEMPDRDESFPYTLFRVKLIGDRNIVRVAKQSLLLNLGQSFQTEKMVTTYDNQILYLVPKGARTIFLTCGDGCEQQMIYSGRLEPNKIYEGTIEVK